MRHHTNSEIFSWSTGQYKMLCVVSFLITLTVHSYSASLVIASDCYEPPCYRDDWSYSQRSQVGFKVDKGHWTRLIISSLFFPCHSIHVHSAVLKNAVTKWGKTKQRYNFNLYQAVTGMNIPI